METKKLLLIILALFALPVFAGTVSIDLGDSGWAAVLDSSISSVGDVEAIYVYGTNADSVFIEIDKRFIAQPDELDFYNPIVIDFVKVSENALSNIVIRDERIVNNTGSTWTGFDMHLITSLLNPLVGFNDNYLPDGDQLETVTYSSYNGYAGMARQISFADNNGQGVEDGQSFRPGYAFGDIVIATSDDMVLGNRFSLKEIPQASLPEPTTILLLAFGIMPAIMKKKKN